MKRICIPITLLLSVFILSSKSYSQDEFPVLEDRYLAQKPPGLIPELFAPGIVATEEYLESEVLFLPDMTELSFTRSGGKYKEPTLFIMQYKDKRWSRKPIPSADINKHKERFSPSVSELKNIDTETERVRAIANRMFNQWNAIHGAYITGQIPQSVYDNLSESVPRVSVVRLIGLALLARHFILSVYGPTNILFNQKKYV